MTLSKKNILQAFVVVLAISASFFVVHAVSAADGVIGWVSDGVTWLVVQVLEGLVSVLGKILIALIALLVWVGTYNNFLDVPGVVIGWNVMRDIANMFFVVLLLLISFGTILRSGKYQLNKSLMGVLAAAVLVNFSKTITGLLIDVSQIIMLTFVSAYQAAGAGNFSQALQLDKILTFEPVSNQQDLQDKAVTMASLFGAYVLALVYVVVSMVVVIAFIMMLVARIVILWALVIFSPFAFMFSQIDLGKKYATQWVEMFTQQLVAGPLLAFFLWLSLTTLPGLVQQFDANALNSSPAGQESSLRHIPSASLTEAGNPQNLFAFIMSVAMLMAGLYFTSKIGGVAGKVAGGAYNKVEGRLVTPFVNGGKRAAELAWAGATYLPKGWGRRARDAASIGALGVAASIPLVGNAALAKKKEIESRRADTIKKRYSGFIGSLDNEELERAARQVDIAPGSFLDKHKGLAKIVAGASRVFGTDYGAGQKTLIRAEMLKRGIMRPQLTNKQIKKDVAELNMLKSKSTELGGDGKLTQAERDRKNELQKQIDGLQGGWKKTIFQNLRSDLGHAIDYNDTDVYQRDQFGLGKVAEDTLRNDPSVLDSGPRQITFGPGKGALMHKNQQLRIKERLSPTQIANLLRGSLHNQEYFDDNMVVPATQARDILKLHQDKIEALGAQPEKKRKAVMASLRGAMSFGRLVLSGGGQRDGKRLDKALFDPSSGFFYANTEGQELVQKVRDVSGLGPEEAIQLLQEVIMGGPPGIQVSGAASARVDRKKLDRTKALYAEHKASTGNDDYAQSEKYKANKDDYYQPDNFKELVAADVREAGQKFNGQQFVEYHKVNGPDSILEQARTAKAGGHETFAEATVDVDMAALGPEFANQDGRSLDIKTDAVLRAEVIKKILEQYKNRYTAEQLAEFEKALNMAQNLSVVEQNLSLAERRRVVAHERSEAWARRNPQAVKEVWNALSPEERETNAARVRDRWGKHLTDDDVAREYYAEASANESPWGRKDGIRFPNQRVRDVWQNADQFAEAGLAAPVPEAAPDDISHTFESVLVQAGQSFDPEIVNQLTQAIRDLSGQVGSLNLKDFGKEGLLAAVKALLQRKTIGDSERVADLLRLIAVNSSKSKRALEAMASKAPAAPVSETQV